MWTAQRTYPETVSLVTRVDISKTERNCISHGSCGERCLKSYRTVKNLKFFKVINKGNSAPNMNRSPAVIVIDVVVLRINHPSVTLGTKRAGNVGKWATSNEFATQERVRTPPDEERRRNPICMPLRWMMNVMMIHVA